MRRLSLLAKFALLGAIPTLLLSVGLGKSLQSNIRNRTMRNVTEGAALASRLGIEPVFADSSLRKGLTPGQAEAIDESFTRINLERNIVELSILTRDGAVLYSSADSVIDLDSRTSDSFRLALAGRPAWEVTDGAGKSHSDLVRILVPVESGGRVVGVAALTRPYEPIADAMEEESTDLLLLLLAGLTLLYFALFRIVSGAAKKLQVQAAANEYQALHDSLTDLPNRQLFRDRVGQAILTARREDLNLGVVLMDLDRFKEINDTLGHHNGDLLLKEVGPRLRGCLRESDTVARLGGDEFAILLPQLTNSAEATQIAEKVRKALDHPFLIEGLSLTVEASIGIACFPEHGQDVDTLLQRADVAMYVAKDSHNGYEVYAAEDDQYTPDRLSLIGELRRAIDNDELVVHYQPKANLKTGEISSVEALVRWQHPERGLMRPDDFIPLAEHTELIKPLSLYVLETAMRQCREWRDAGYTLSVAVNLSTRSLLDEQFPRDVAALVSKFKFDPTWLQFEITESTLMADAWRAMSVLERLSAMGVGLSIDDYGTGYSSLSYVKRLPIREIKIDKSFVMNMATDENDAVIVRSTIDLGRNLGLRVVAEGVETEEVWNQLVMLGCDMAQGFYLSVPVPADKLTESVDSSLEASARQALSYPTQRLALGLNT
jgi:diguanylate cyclase (GGDEF)-like protein